MSLPDNFSSTQHLLSVARLEQNAIVKRFFKDLGETWEPEIKTARGSLRTACTINSSDSQIQVVSKQLLLQMTLGYAFTNCIQYFGDRDKISTPVSGTPKVVLYFSQDASAVPAGYSKIEAEISFRLMNETGQTYTPAKALTLANLVKQHFTTSGVGVTFTKGKNIYSYKDDDNGYRLQIYASNKSDAVNIITRCLEVQHLTYDDTILTVSTPETTSQNTATNQIVYGKSLKKKRFRPTANVQFRYAYLEVPGLPKKVFLVDTIHRYANSLLFVG